ncbi:DUF4113 domain-containing protein [Sphaerotilus montanus]|nr:DUF4113 domain-containing protein [Sphaerotilus montanus]
MRARHPENRERAGPAVTPWPGKQERRTLAYTTCWYEMPVVRT